MTREEHISNLETIGCDGWTGTTEAYKSLQFAIKVLKQEPCEDCISRKELIKSKFIIAENEYEKTWNDALDAVYENAPSTQPKIPHWNCGLPDAGGEYIITVRERWGKDEEWEYETLGAWYTSQDEWEPSYDIDEGQEWEIIAWMPLPEPYKAESEDKE